MSLLRNSAFSYFFFSLAVVTILDLVLSSSVEISPRGDVSSKEDYIVVYCQTLMFSAFQEWFCDVKCWYASMSHTFYS